MLGDMLELGRYETQGHQKVGIRAAEVVDILVTVGQLAEIISKAAADAGFQKENIYSFADSAGAVKFLKQFLTEDDMVLVKGSRGMRMDKIVASLEVVL